MWLFITILEVVIGIAVIVIARACRFDERFYDVREAYMGFVDAGFKSYGRMLRKIDEGSKARFVWLRRFDEKLGRLILWVFYLLGLGMALLGTRSIFAGRYEPMDIFFILSIPAAVAFYLYMADKGRSRERNIIEDGPQDSC